MGDVEAGRSLVIPAAEIEVRFSPSGGPGGQHANKAATRVELVWNIERSGVISERQRRTLRTNLRHRLDASGTVRVVSDETRSQHQNRSNAERRLGQLIATALRPRKSRRATAPSRSARERRLREKKQRGDLKQQRRSPEW